MYDLLRCDDYKFSSSSCKVKKEKESLNVKERETSLNAERGDEVMLMNQVSGSNVGMLRMEYFLIEKS